MNQSDLRTRRDALKARTHGNWVAILKTLHVSEDLLTRRNQPCPFCKDGTDRYQFTDKFGNGDSFCRFCGHHDGFDLYMAHSGRDFPAALRDVEHAVGVAPPALQSLEPSADRLKAIASKLWRQAVPITRDDEVDRYLASRGLRLPSYPRTLRFHPALEYSDLGSDRKRVVLGKYPAMLALIQDADGNACALHRTYLQNGAKAPVPTVRKTLNDRNSGNAIRLFQPADELALAEGIETALAIHLATGKSVWAAINAFNLPKVTIPPTVKRVCIYGDNDANSDFDGQASAFEFARRLRKQRRDGFSLEVQVFIPRDPGMDWADVWRARNQVRQAA